MQNSPSSPITTPKNFWFYAVVIALLSLLLKLPTLTGEVMMDDRLLLSMPDQRGCEVSLGECFRIPLFHLYYRPVLSASFLLGVKLHGTAPLWFHAENLVLHFVAVLIWLGVFRKQFRQESTALVAGVLFALHPVQVGVSGFIGGRTDTLALVFSGSALLTLSVRDKTLKASSLISLLCFAVAVFTKEQSGFAVLLIPLLLSFTSSLTKKQCLFITIPYWGVLVFYLLVAKTVVPPSFLPRLGLSVPLHTEIIGRTLWYYAKTICGLVPNTFHQSSLGAWNPSQWGAALLGYGVLGGWIGFYVRACRKEERLRWCWWWVSLALLPCLNIVPTPSQFIAPYRVPLALPGMVGIVAFYLAERNPLSVPVKRGVLLGCILLYGGITWHEALLWRNEIPVLQTMTQVDTDFLPAHLWLGNAYQLREQHTAALQEFTTIWKRLEMSSLSPLQKRNTSKQPPMRSKVWNLCGWSYSAPRFTRWVLQGEGRSLVGLTDYTHAIPTLEVALIGDENNLETLHLLAYAYIESREYSKATTVLVEQIGNRANAMTFHLRGYLYAKQERWQAAQGALQRATTLLPPLDTKTLENNRLLLLYVQQHLQRK